MSSTSGGNVVACGGIPSRRLDLVGDGSNQECEAAENASHKISTCHDFEHCGKRLKSSCILGIVGRQE
jgi:hypothetical protein